MDQSLRALFEALEGFHAESLPLIPSVSAARIREDLAARFNPEHPRPLEDLISDTAALLRVGLTHSTHPRHFGLFNPTTTMASVAADALVARFNPQLAVWQSAPAAVEMEQYALAAMARRIGLDPARCTMTFTSGGAEANHAAMALALTRAVPGYVTEGLVGSTVRPAVYLSTEAHGSLAKAAQLTGIGRAALRHVPVDRALRMNLRALRKLIEGDRAAGLTPAMIVATIGTTSSGAVDPVRELVTLAGDEGAWLHVDAAWGGIAALSSVARTVVDGIEQADSVTWDAHKSLPVAMGAGMLFCQFPDVARALFEVEAPYMMRGDDDRVHPYLTSMQWSRRFIGLKVLLTLASLGWSGVTAMVDRQFALANRLRAALVAQGWEVVNESPLPVVCFTHPTLQSGKVTLRHVLHTLWRGDLAWISETRLAGRIQCLRACVTNADTTEHDIDVLVEALASAVR